MGLGGEGKGSPEGKVGKGGKGGRRREKEGKGPSFMDPRYAPGRHCDNCHIGRRAT